MLEKRSFRISADLAACEISDTTDICGWSLCFQIGRKKAFNSEKRSDLLLGLSTYFILKQNCLTLFYVL